MRRIGNHLPMYSASRRARSSFGSTTASVSTTRKAALLVVRRVTVRRAGAFLAAVFLAVAGLAGALAAFVAALAVFAVFAAFFAAGRLRGPVATRLGVSFMMPALRARVATRMVAGPRGPGPAGR